MKYTISILSDAVSDIDEAYLWYELNQSGLGKIFIRNIEEAFDSISRDPSGYVKIYQETRRFLVHKFPYGIYYLTDNNKREIKVVGVIHFKRNPRILKYRTKKLR
jgi:plasmid stabilization system protein ParE